MGGVESWRGSIDFATLGAGIDIRCPEVQSTGLAL
jgi:hypothetical protein